MIAERISRPAAAAAASKVPKLSAWLNTKTALAAELQQSRSNLWLLLQTSWNLQWAKILMNFQI